MGRFLSFLFVAVLGVSHADRFDVDRSHSGVSFSISYLGLTEVEGSFHKFSGHADIDTSTGTITDLNGSVDIESIHTRNEKRDNHLLSQDFFHHEKFPEASFKLVSVDKLKDSNKVKVVADITIRDVTKSVTFDGVMNGPVKHPRNGKTLYGLSLYGELSRKGYNLANTPSSNAMLGDKVGIKINLDLISGQ